MVVQTHHLGRLDVLYRWLAVSRGTRFWCCDTRVKIGLFVSAHACNIHLTEGGSSQYPWYLRNWNHLLRSLYSVWPLNWRYAYYLRKTTRYAVAINELRWNLLDAKASGGFYFGDKFDEINVIVKNENGGTQSWCRRPDAFATVTNIHDVMYRPKRIASSTQLNRNNVNMDVTCSARWLHPFCLIGWLTLSLTRIKRTKETLLRSGVLQHTSMCCGDELILLTPWDC